LVEISYSTILKNKKKKQLGPVSFPTFPSHYSQHF